MDLIKNLVDIFQKLVTGLGIILGGFWTYRLFIVQRLGQPKLNKRLLIHEDSIADNRRLVHCELELSNVGSVKLTSDYAELRLRQILPILENELKQIINNGIDPVLEGKTEIKWPMFAGREWKWKENEFEIEPGENDSLHADFVIPSDIESAEFYFYLKNSKKKRQAIGWTLTNIYTFKNREGREMSKDDKDKKINEEIIEKQQRQQEQQQQQQQQKQQQTKKNQSDKK